MGLLHHRVVFAADEGVVTKPHSVSPALPALSFDYLHAAARRILCTWPTDCTKARNTIVACPSACTAE